MPPVNPNFNPPPNTWEGGKFTIPPGVLQMLAAKQGQQGAAPGMGGGAPQGQPLGWSQYGLQNPDVMAEWQKLGANPKNPFKSADEYFQWHYDNFGKKEGRPGVSGGAPPAGVLAQLGQQQGPQISPQGGMMSLMGQLMAQRQAQ